MKNALSTLWLLLVAALLAASCQEEETVTDLPGVSQSTWTTGVTIAADETSAEYTFQAAGPWIASSQQSWCKVTTKGQAGASTLTLTFEPNPSREERTTLISIAFTDGYKGDSFAFSDEVIDKCDVFLTPGGIFGSEGERYIRITLCCPEELLKKATDNIVAKFRK